MLFILFPLFAGGIMGWMIFYFIRKYDRFALKACIEEEPKSNYAVVGLYLYPNQPVGIVKNITLLCPGANWKPGRSITNNK